MNLHPSIQAYFEADQSLPLEAFSPDAVVEDEGHRHVGHASIEAWFLDYREKYQAVAQPLETTARDAAHDVRAKVTGQFPGSPITLTFSFQLESDRIAALKIGG